MAMVTRTLGRTNLKVTPLGFGAMEIRGPKVWGGRKVTPEQAERILNAVLDAGVNFIDTAYDYGDSEEFIGRFISSRRKEYYLATKCGCDPRNLGDRIETPPTWTRDNLLRNIHGSLQRMRTDHVDILQLHNPSVEEAAREKVVDTLKDIQAQGLTRFISISSTLPALEEFAKMGVFDTFQIPYSCLEPSHHDAITLAARSGAGTIIRGGIARGGPESDTPRGQLNALGRKARLEELTGGMSPSELILRYTLSHPHAHTVIVGTMNVEHLKANVQAAQKGPLPKDLYDQVRRRVAEHLPPRAAGGG
jgi:aryl-alcohol dehydrogenase-like predicted oxidoreductase